MLKGHIYKYALTALSLSALSGYSAGVQLEGDKYVWHFSSGLEWPAGYNQDTGKPDSLIYAYPQYPSEFFDRINNALPEAKVNEAFLVSDEGANITLVEEGEVFITFIHEGAGYKNSFGYFTFDSENPPTSIYDIQEIIAFPNLSYPHLTNGHRVSLGTFPSGTSIGFFIAANGFWYYSGVKDWAIPYYYSLKDLNPDPTDELRQHNVLLYDEEVEEVILGFEDLPRAWGDNDFNDAVFAVKVTPGEALATQNLVRVPSANDSDADGIVDSGDEFPNDFFRAYSSFYPSANDYVTLAFEDNWPQKGDYDMNDLVVREQLQTTFNAAGEVTGFIMNGFIDARGAQTKNGFAVRLLDHPANNLAKASITINDIRYEKSAEGYQSDLVLQLWRDTHLFTTTAEPGACSHFNTRKECVQHQPVPFTLDVRFATPILQLNHSDLDFFIFRTNERGHEIHFADYPPTDLFNEFLLGQGIDDSDPSSNRYFRDINNLPWALKIDTDWQYPREYIDVVWAYPDYATWVESGGSEAPDWHSTSTLTTHYYEK